MSAHAPQHPDPLPETRDALETALAMLRARPDAMRLFLSSALASVSAIRATLRLPARDPEALRDKLGRLQAEAAQLGTEAHLMHLDPAVRACRRLADRTALLLEQPCSGDALLPLAVLVDQIATALGNAVRIEEQRFIEPAPRPAAAESRPRRAADWALASERRWSGFLRRRGEELGTLVRFALEGAQHVPHEQRRHVDELLQQLLRNAADHGIETPEERLAAGKAAAGHVTVRFEDEGARGIRMTVRDDGRGFDVQRIGQAAVRCGLLTEESLLEHDAGEVVGLIFKPAFTIEALEGEAGRGRGLAFLRRTVTRIGGQISVATKPGHYTQFIVDLPNLSATGDPHAPAA